MLFCCPGHPSGIAFVQPENILFIENIHWRGNLNPLIWSLNNFIPPLFFKRFVPFSYVMCACWCGGEKETVWKQQYRAQGIDAERHSHLHTLFHCKPPLRVALPLPAGRCVFLRKKRRKAITQSRRTRETISIISHMA